MAREIRLTERAISDDDKIWDYTARKYGEEQADRYKSLIDHALDDIRQDPERPTSQLHLSYGTHYRSYRIELSKERSGTGIKSARHIVFYTLEYEDAIYVVRILHEKMNPDLHLPED